jgi:hypothetical protein
LTQAAALEHSDKHSADAKLEQHTHLESPKAWLLQLGARHPQVSSQPVLLLLLLRCCPQGSQPWQSTLLLLLLQWLWATQQVEAAGGLGTGSQACKQVIQWC